MAPLETEMFPVIQYPALSYLPRISHKKQGDVHLFPSSTFFDCTPIGVESVSFPSLHSAFCTAPYKGYVLYYMIYLPKSPTFLTILFHIKEREILWSSV
jgi:hypothetical protein